MLRHGMRHPCQVAAQHIDDHGDKHQQHADPEPPVIVRAFPIWNVGMIRTAVPRSVFALVLHIDLPVCGWECRMPAGHTMGWFSGRHSMRLAHGFETSGMPVLVPGGPVGPAFSEPDPLSGCVDMSDSCLRGQSPIGMVSRSCDFMALFLSNYDS